MKSDRLLYEADYKHPPITDTDILDHILGPKTVSHECGNRRTDANKHYLPAMQWETN